MSKELILVADAVANEKAIPRQAIFEALEAALASAARKRLSPDDALVRVDIDQHTGDYRAFRRWEVVADDVVMEDPARQIRLMDAIDEDPALEVGQYLEEPLETPEFGRIAAQGAKQVVIQRVREAERALIREEWADRVGEMVNGVVKRFEKGQTYLDLGGGAEGVISRAHAIPAERLKVGNRVRAILVEINPEAKGPQLILSRIAPELMIELFRLEVPEVGQGIVEIKGCARDPGDRAKIAVLSHDRRVDPVGTCIGMRGARVQAVSMELSGEKVDIITWSEKDAEFVVNAMAPAEIESIVLDEEARSMDVAVASERLAQAIGRGGQNVRLASRLTGWKINVMSKEELGAKREAEQQAHVALFVGDLEVDEEIASLLVEEGFSSIEEIAYVPVAELLAIDGFDEEIVEELRVRARDVLLNRELAVEESKGLQGLAGMDDALQKELLKVGIETQEDLANMAVDEVVDLPGMTPERASALIMEARRPWFE